VTRVLALDVGSTAARALVFEADGSPVRGAQAKVLHGGLEDASELAGVSERLVGEALALGGPVDAVGISCFWHSVLALDGQGQPLTPILPWRNTGAADDADELARRLDAEDVRQRTGCVLHPSYWPAKLAWLRRTDPDTFGAAARFVSFAEYLLPRLVTSCDKAPMSVSMASGTGLWRLDGGWDEELLDAIGVEPERLPVVSDEPVGDDRPWYPALGDGACANLGVGAVSRTHGAVTLGTSGALRVVRPDRPDDDPPGLFLYRVDEGRFLEGGALSDGNNLWYWLLRTLRLPRRPQLDGRAPDAHGMTFLPLLGGERSVGWDPRARGAIAGIGFDTTPLDLLQAAIEGVALRFAEIGARLPHVASLVVAGGGMAARPWWLQTIADALDRPVERSPVAEASARGAAVWALERLGQRPDQPPPSARFVPRPEAVATLAGARRRQSSLRDTLAGREWR
jgi:gluconokinase